MKPRRNTKQIGTVLGLSALLGLGALTAARPASADRDDWNRGYHHRVRDDRFEVGRLDRHGREMALGDYVGANGVFHRGVRGYLDRDGRFRPYEADVAGWYDRNGVFHARPR